MSTNDIFPISGIQGVKIGSQFATRFNRAQSGNGQAVKGGGQYWTFEIDLCKKERWEADQICAFLNAQEGRLKSFKLILPTYSRTKGTALKAGTPQYGGFNIGNALFTTGWQPNKRGLLKKGDFVRFDGDLKVYQLVEDLDSDNSGNGSITVAPSLIKVPNTGAALIYNNVDFTVANSSDLVSMDLDILRMADWKITLEERY